MSDYILTFLTLLIAYIYIGYPLILWLMATLFPERHTWDDSHEPTVTLIISCYNEEKVIAQKILNSLALDYPKEKLRILVVSDSSTDATDAIVKSFADRGVILERQEERKGKTAGLNKAVAKISSEIVIFSDGNAMYHPLAVRKLVRHFADQKVGYAVGHARYTKSSDTSAGSSESLYWDLEVRVKVWESRFSSVVGGDGAIYAVRRKLYEELREEDINDFVNPLQVITKGYRGIFDPEAWCSEQAAGDFHKEFARKIRITNRSLNGLMRVPHACNPMKSGLFAWQLLSHKLLRWLSPFFLLLHLAVTAAAGWPPPISRLTILFTSLYGLTAALALAGWWKDRKGKPHPIFYIPYYVVLMNAALALGVLIRMKGEVITVWETVREDQFLRSRMVCLMPFFLSSVILVCISRVFQWAGAGLFLQHASLVLLLVILAYTYVGYPMVAALLARLYPVHTGSNEQWFPQVTLLITAYNESRFIREKMENSLCLDYPDDKLRILVASDGSTDETNEIVASFRSRGAELLDFPVNRGKMATLNEAIKEIDSEIVILSDANVMYAPEVIRKLVRHFVDPRVGAVSGKVVLCNGGVSYAVAEKGYYGIEHFVQEKEGKTGAVIGGDGAMYAIRRELFSSLPSDTILDDFIIVMSIARKGYFVLHEREALGYEQNVNEIGNEFRRKSRIIAGGIQCLLAGEAMPRSSQKLLWFKFISHKVLRWLSGLFSLLLLVVLVEISRTENTLWLSILLVLMLVATLGHIVPGSRRIIPIGFLHYLFMLKCAAMLGCYLGFTGRQKVTWRQS